MMQLPALVAVAYTRDHGWHLTTVDAEAFARADLEADGTCDLVLVDIADLPLERPHVLDLASYDIAVGGAA